MARDNWLRLLSALLAPPVVVSAAGALAFALAGPCSVRPACTADTLAMVAAWGGLFGLLFGGPAAVLLGLPAHHFLLRMGKKHALFYALAGAIVGLPTAIAIFLWSSGLPMGAGGWLVALAIGALIGALSALLFWLIRRPDRDALPNPPTSPS
jgi:hypothetical protein